MPAIGISMPVVCDQLRLNGYPTRGLSRKACRAASRQVGFTDVTCLTAATAEHGPSEDSCSALWKAFHKAEDPSKYEYGRKAVVPRKPPLRSRRVEGPTRVGRQSPLRGLIDNWQKWTGVGRSIQ